MRTLRDEPRSERGRVVVVTVGEAWGGGDHPAAVFAVRASRLTEHCGAPVRLVGAGADVRDTKAAQWGAGLRISTGPGTQLERALTAVESVDQFAYTFIAAGSLLESLELAELADTTIVAVETRAESVFAMLAAHRDVHLETPVHLVAWAVRGGDLQPAGVARSLTDFTYAGHVTGGGHKGGPGHGVGRALHAATRDPRLTPRRLHRVAGHSSARRAATVQR